MISITLGENEEKEVDLDRGNITLIADFDKREDQQVRTLYLTNKNTKASRSLRLESSNKMENLAPGKYGYTVYSVRTQIATGELTIPDDEPEFRYTFVINKGRIKGKIQTAAEKPVSGAIIKITKSQETSSDDSFSASSMESLQDGTFEFDNLSNGTYTITAQKVDAGFTSKENIQVGQTDTNIVLTLHEKGGDLESLTIHAETGEPIRTATVAITDGIRRYTYSHKRDTNGIMKIRNVPPGKYSVEVKAANYTESTHEIKVESEKTTVIEDALYPAGSLSWKLLTDDGEPAQDISVEITNPRPKADRDNRSVKTNSDGKVSESGLSLGTYILTATFNDKTISEDFILRDEETVEKETRLPKSR